MDGHINGALITAGTIKGDMLEGYNYNKRIKRLRFKQQLIVPMTQETTQALITANLNQFESNLSQTFITEEEATKQIQDATKSQLNKQLNKLLIHQLKESNGKC